MMEVGNLKAAKAELEQKIRNDIAKRLESFKAETGLGARGVEVEFHSSGGIGGSGSYELNRVVVDIDL
ncbi:MAG: hypothetical protein ABJM39_11830 [Porticoccus sp.]|uniref:hypothetical protein n=1 Tax=Porticoccus sp. TaxID=2024853 RepID=UPI003296F99D